MSALQAIPTPHGISILNSELRTTVTQYRLMGSKDATSDLWQSFYENTIETSYYDDNGVLTFVLDLPVEQHFEEYLHQIHVLDSNNQPVIKCSTPKVALPKGIGGMVTIKAALSGQAGEIIFKHSEFVTETELKELYIPPIYEDMAQLPLYPEILTDDKKFVMSLSGTTVTVADNQVIRMRGWKDANTSNLTRTFTIVLDKTYHLRLSIDKGLYISLVDDVTYNPDGLPETDKKFDSTYDDALIAKIESGVITPLINTSETFNLTYDGMPNSADSQSTGNDWIGAFELPLNWSRTPVSDSVEQKGQLAVLGNHAWTDHMVMTVLAMREDARLCPLGFDKTYRLNRYECRLPVAHAHGKTHYPMGEPVPYLQTFEKIVRVYGY